MHNSSTKQDFTEDSDLKFWLAFTRIEKIGASRFNRLYKFFGSAEAAWQASLPEIVLAGIEEQVAEELICARKNIFPEAELEKIEASNINICRIIDDNYPELLKQINNPPHIFFYLGSLKIFEQKNIAIVGTRKSSIYGQEVLHYLVPQLVNAGLGIVSGLAMGVDALAHQAAINAGGLTAAVLGGGLDIISYPVSNQKLASDIIKSGGCIMSDFALGTAPSKITFPMRNRIVAGLTQGTLVIEAPESSGSLITAQFALDYNREVFAIPGNIFAENNRGTNKLIKEGAKLVTRVQDILEELKMEEISGDIELNKPKNISTEEAHILSFIDHEGIHIDKIAFYSKIKITALSSILMTMELNGLIKDLGGKKYIKL